LLRTRKVYVRSVFNLKWQCAKGHTWEASFNNIKNCGQWCPSCLSSRSEKECRTIFEDVLLEKFPTKRPKFLKGLELNEYNPDLQIAFEYNGKQHYEHVEFFHKGKVSNFKAQLARDQKKYEICAQKYSYQKPEELRNFILKRLWAIL